MTPIGTPSKVPSNWLDTIKKEMMNKKAYDTIKSIASTRSFKILWAKFTVHQSKDNLYIYIYRTEPSNLSQYLKKNIKQKNKTKTKKKKKKKKHRHKPRHSKRKM